MAILALLSPSDTMPAPRGSDSSAGVVVFAADPLQDIRTDHDARAGVTAGKMRAPRRWPAAGPHPAPVGAPGAAAGPGTFLTGDGTRIYYEDCGNGPTVVLLHDGLMHSVTWDAVWPALCTRFHVLRYDRRGMGRSEVPQKPFIPAEDLSALLADRRVATATLVGSSSGAGLAIDYALRHPEKVERLVLLGPVVHGMMSSSHFLERGAKNSAPLAHGQLQLAARNWANDRYQIAAGHDSVRRTLLRTLVANPQNLRYQGNLELRFIVPAAARLGEVRVPTLILVGESDIADVQAYAGALELGIWGALREVVPHAGHLLQLEQPDLVERRISDFIVTHPVVTLEEPVLQACAGAFDSLMYGHRGEFYVKDDRLMLRVPTERDLPLFPSSDSTFYALARGGIRVTCRRDATGKVAAADVDEAGVVHRAMRRSEPPDKARDAQMPVTGIDFSGVDRFWEVADILAKDLEPTESQWHALLSTPGYRLAVINIGEGVRDDIDVALKPSRHAEFERLVAAGDARSAVLKHLALAVAQRPALMALRDSLSRATPIADGVALAARYLPPDATKSGDPPLLAFAIFRDDGYSLPQGIVIDFLNAHGSTLIPTLGHEFHHAYVNRMARPLPPGSATAPDAGLREALYNLRNEGLADLIDKPYPFSYPNPALAGYVARYNREYDHTPGVVQELDSLLTLAYDDPAAIGAVSSRAQGLFWSNGHPNGSYIARAIYRAFGVDSLYPAAYSPAAFLRIYAAAEIVGDRPAPFSSKALLQLDRMDVAYWRR